VPLGFLRYRVNPATAWAAFLIATLSNVVWGLGTMAVVGMPLGDLLLDCAFFAVITGLFIGIISPLKVGKFRFAGRSRMIAGSLAGAAFFLFFFLQALKSEQAMAVVSAQIDALKALYAPTDVTQRALMDAVTTSSIVAFVKSVMIRGGALMSVIAFYWLSRLFSLGFSRLAKGSYEGSLLRDFYVPRAVIWVLSFSLLFIIVGRTAALVPVEETMWNVLVLCAALFLAQGFGVVQYLLAGKMGAQRGLIPFPLMLLFLLLIFSPGINAVLLGLLILLGIVDNWASFRTPKTQSSPPDTPTE
jgi:hypothetical protein